MAVIKELIRTEADGSISFGNHTLDAKAKLEDFPHDGASYKVKTYQTMTKLTKNGDFVYESVPGTSVSHFTETPEGVTFTVEGDEGAQLTIGLKDDTSYEVLVAGNSVGKMSTAFGGKLTLSVDLADEDEVEVKVVEA